MTRRKTPWTYQDTRGTRTAAHQIPRSENADNTSLSVLRLTALALPLHDGMIVPRTAAGEAEGTLKWAFERVAGVRVRVTLDPPSAPVAAAPERPYSSLEVGRRDKLRHDSEAL
jgi:hypothetical protein